MIRFSRTLRLLVASPKDKLVLHYANNQVQSIDPPDPNQLDAIVCGLGWYFEPLYWR